MKRIVDFIKWAISRFGPATEAEIDFWPFPAETKSVKSTLPVEKKKPALKKATTRKPKAVAKKATTVVKKTTKAKTK